MSDHLIHHDRTEAVIAMRNRRVSVEKIARYLGLHKDTVRQILRANRSRVTYHVPDGRTVGIGLDKQDAEEVDARRQALHDLRVPPELMDTRPAFDGEYLR